MIEISGKILNFYTCDNQGDLILPDCSVDFIDDTVPPLINWTDSVGIARLFKQDDGVYATMVLEDDVFEKMKILKPCIGGKVFEKQQVKLLTKATSDGLMANVNLLTRIVIDNVNLDQQNQDHSIKKLEEMKNDARA